MMDCDSNDETLARALDHLLSAIQLLDLAGAPSQIAAHVDLSACQLADLIGAGNLMPSCPSQAVGAVAAHCSHNGGTGEFVRT